MKREEWLEQHKDLFDERKATVFSDAKSLPNGTYGLCLLCIKGNFLIVYDTDFSQNVGILEYEIPLKEITGLKSSSFVFNRYIKFGYQGFQYVFADFGDAKRFIQILEEEASK